MVLLGAVVGLVLVGCGNDGDELTGDATTSSTAGPSSTTVAPTTSRPTTATTSAPSTTTTQKRGREIAYPSGGARGPVFPPNDPAYELLHNGGSSCAELLGKIESWGDPTPTAGFADQTSAQVPLTEFYLYRSAARLCVGRWSEAVADFRRVQALAPTFESSCERWDPENSCERCLAVVYAWADEVVAEYLRDPAHPPTFVAGAAADRCASGAPTGGG